jgi:adenylyltransferase/sulfurtransferase
VHSDGDVGTAKTSSAAARLRALNPDVAVVEHTVRLAEGNAAELFAGYDVVVDGSDTFATRYLVGDTCEALGKPEVWGSVLRFDGQLSVSWSPYGPGYRDLHPQAPPDDAVPSCSDVGVSGALCGTIGSLMAAEVVKLITGNGEPLVGRILVHDGLTGRFREVRVRPDPRRPRATEPTAASGRGAEPTEASGRGAEPGRLRTQPAPADAVVGGFVVPADRLDALVAAGEVLVVDVRDPGQTSSLLPGAVAVPLEDFADPDVVGRLIERAAGRRLVAVCPVGRRSAAAARVLRAAGAEDAAHVEGGLQAWLAGGPTRRNA